MAQMDETVIRLAVAVIEIYVGFGIVYFVPYILHILQSIREMVDGRHPRERRGLLSPVSVDLHAKRSGNANPKKAITRFVSVEGYCSNARELSGTTGEHASDELQHGGALVRGRSLVKI